MAFVQPEYVEVARISHLDLEQLTREPSAKARTQLCEKICASYNDKAYTEREADVALEIMRLLLRDTSIRVRRTLSERLKHNRDVPHDIVLKLAQDEELVAEAVLSHSPVLNEDDLLAVVASTHNLRKLLAVAGRDTLSSGVAKALIDDGTHSVTMRVIENKSAHLEDETFAWLLEEYYEDDSILEALVERGGLPYGVAQKLFYLVSDQYKNHLSEHYGLREEWIEDLGAYGSEQSMLRFLSPWMAQQDIHQIIQELFRQDQLSNSLVIRSLCIGDLRFFQTAIAKRAGIPVSNARILLLDPQQKGFDACYDKAALPANLKAAVRVLYDCALEETQVGRYFHDQFTSRVIAKITSRGYDRSVPEMTTVLGMLNASAQEGMGNARRHA